MDLWQHQGEPLQRRSVGFSIVAEAVWIGESSAVDGGHGISC
jgi:hypothetical protein